MIHRTRLASDRRDFDALIEHQWAIFFKRDLHGVERNGIGDSDILLLLHATFRIGLPKKSRTALIQHPHARILFQKALLVQIGYRDELDARGWIPEKIPCQAMRSHRAFFQGSYRSGLESSRTCDRRKRFDSWNLDALTAFQAFLNEQILLRYAATRAVLISGDESARGLHASREIHAGDRILQRQLAIGFGAVGIGGAREKELSILHEDDGCSRDRIEGGDQFFSTPFQIHFVCFWNPDLHRAIRKESLTGP